MPDVWYLLSAIGKSVSLDLYLLAQQDQEGKYLMQFKSKFSSMCLDLVVKTNTPLKMYDVLFAH